MGQAKKNRVVCPVTGKQIQPAECGANRMSKYACPESCPQNPWSVENYDRHLEIDFRTAGRGISRLAEEAARNGRVLSPPPGETGNEIRLMVYFLTNFFRERDAQGKTFFERWEKEHFAGLNNDQALMFRCMSGFYSVVAEVLHVMDDRRVLVVDRLSADRKPMLLVDYSLAARACRFSAYLVFVYKTPFFYRLQSAAIPVPDISGMEPEEIVRELVRHHNGPTESTDSLREWLFENVLLTAESLTAVETARKTAMFRQLDAVFTKSFYRFSGTSSDFAEVMNNHPDIHAEAPFEEEADEETIGHWVWTLEGSMVGTGRTVLCTILLREDNQVRLETATARHREQAKPLFEQLFGDKVTFDSEIVKDLSMQMMRNQRHYYDPKLVPDKLLENTETLDLSRTCLPPEFKGLSQDEVMRKVHEMFLRGFSDHRLPVLGGKTPRQAADDPALRPTLLHVMKKHVLRNDQEDLKKGMQTDVNSLLRELKLDEIIFPPPPLRTVDWEDDEYDAEEKEWENDDDIYDVDGPLIIPPDEVEYRMEELTGRDRDVAVHHLRACFPNAYTLLQGCFSAGGVKQPLQSRIVALAANISQLFFPDAETTPHIARARLAAAMDEVVDVALEEDRDAWADYGYQPHVLQYALRQLDEITGDSRTEPMIHIMIFFTAFINELHAEFREQVLRTYDDIPFPSDHS